MGKTLFVGLLGVPWAELTPCHEKLRIPARKNRARVRSRPYGSGIWVPQCSEAGTEPVSQLVPRVALGPSSSAKVRLALINEHVGKPSAQLLGIFGLRLGEKHAGGCTTYQVYMRAFGVRASCD